jgi:hypothetical protein
VDKTHRGEFVSETTNMQEVIPIKHHEASLQEVFT